MAFFQFRALQEQQFRVRHQQRLIATKGAGT